MKKLKLLLKTFYTFLLLQIEALKQPKKVDLSLVGTLSDSNKAYGHLTHLAHNLCASVNKSTPYIISLNRRNYFDFNSLMDILEEHYEIELITSTSNLDEFTSYGNVKKIEHEINSRLYKVKLPSGRFMFMCMNNRPYHIGEYKEYDYKNFPYSDNPKILKQLKIKEDEGLNSIIEKAKKNYKVEFPEKECAYGITLFLHKDDADEYYDRFWKFCSLAALHYVERPKAKPVANYYKVEVTEQYGSVHYNSVRIDNLKKRIMSKEDIDLHYMPTKLKIKGKEHEIPMSKIYEVGLEHFITSEKGILPLAGLPGTGKTRLLMSMVHELTKDYGITVLRIDSSLLPQLADPKFEGFIRDFAASAKNPVLWIEDADDVIKTKDISKGRSAAVSTFLNFIDGPGFEEYGLRAIITFNCDISEVDDALLRDGRSILGDGQAVEVTSLSREKCFALVEKNLKETTDEDKLMEFFAEDPERKITLATLYNSYSKSSSISKLEQKLLDDTERAKKKKSLKVDKDKQEIVEAAIEEVTVSEEPVSFDVLQDFDVLDEM